MMPADRAQARRLQRRAHGRIQRAVRWSMRARMPAWLAAGSHVPASRGTLAGASGTTHVSCMHTLTKTELVGFMELQVGSLAVQVPIRAAEPLPMLPLVSFEVEGDACAILIRGDSSSKAVERGMGEAAKQAVVHLSRKLLN